MQPSQQGGEDADATDPLNGLPWYRLLTGKDDRGFCDRVSEAVAAGWQLHGSPCAAGLPDGSLRVAQALIWAGGATGAGHI
ncbi:MAG: DUF1737 domain-containing protein [Actinomycetota bacterium]|nr:DUF1737 domain-containing protein [Actinomycetota bacterium]